MKLIVKTTTGDLELTYLKDRPLSFSEYKSPKKRVIIYPSDRADFEAVMLGRDGRTLNAPIESSLAASFLFAMRGIPVGALELFSCGERFSLPSHSLGNAKYRDFRIKYKQQFTKSDVESFGILHSAYTSIGRYRTRIVELPSGGELSCELLPRLNIVTGLPDAVRTIALSESGGKYRIYTSEEEVTLDGILAVMGFLARRGVRGRIPLSLSDGDLALTLEADNCGTPFLTIRFALC